MAKGRFTKYTRAVKVGKKTTITRFKDAVIVHLVSRNICAAEKAQ